MGETARRSVGNRKERQDDATMRVPRVRRRPVDAMKPVLNARERSLQSSMSARLLRVRYREEQSPLLLVCGHSEENLIAWERIQ